MFYKILSIAAVIAACAGEAPIEPHSSGEAVSSQSFVRHDVPLSYKMFATHPRYVPKNYATPATVNYVTPVAKQPHYATEEYVTQSPKQVQYQSSPSPYAHSQDPERYQSTQAPEYDDGSAEEYSRNYYQSTAAPQYVTPQAFPKSHFQPTPAPEYSIQHQSYPQRPSQPFFTKVSQSAGSRPPVQYTQAYFLPRQEQKAVQGHYQSQQQSTGPVQFQAVPERPAQDAYLHQETPVRYVSSDAHTQASQQASVYPQIVMYRIAVPANSHSVAPGNPFKQQVAEVPSNGIQYYTRQYNGHEQQSPALAKLSVPLFKPIPSLKSNPIYVAQTYSKPSYNAQIYTKSDLPQATKSIQYVHPKGQYYRSPEQDTGASNIQTTKLYAVQGHLQQYVQQ